MPYSQSDLDALDAKILAAGVVKNSTISDQSTTFRDIEDMLRLREIMARSIAGGSRTRYAATSKGC